MKHVTYGEKSLFLDDATADALLEYAVLLAEAQRADAVTVPGYATDGMRVDVTLVLSGAVALVAETTDVADPPAVDHPWLSELRSRIVRLADPPPLQADSDPRPSRDEGPC